MLAGVSAFGFAYTLSKHSHMRVTLLFPYVPASVQSLLNALAMVTLAAMAAFCAWRGGAEVLELVTSGKRSNTPLSGPLWMPQSIWLAGMVLFARRRRRHGVAFARPPGRRPDAPQPPLRAAVARGGDFHRDRARRAG